ncbi:hypothetical protein AKO1_000348 [Acrasis kona]|uniref:Uncharacterized protein n=1 Tax=Acrasis kona TaxID=1008807 RepID=A0AAW2YNC0_9EUKA
MIDHRRQQEQQQLQLQQAQQQAQQAQQQQNAQQQQQAQQQAQQQQAEQQARQQALLQQQLAEQQAQHQAQQQQAQAQLQQQQQGLQPTNFNFNEFAAFSSAFNAYQQYKQSNPSVLGARTSSVAFPEDSVLGDLLRPPSNVPRIFNNVGCSSDQIALNAEAITRRYTRFYDIPDVHRAQALDILDPDLQERAKKGQFQLSHFQTPSTPPISNWTLQKNFLTTQPPVNTT